MSAHSSFQELDIRLNPVTKNEPDHRLFLVHMLPNLKKLGMFIGELNNHFAYTYSSHPLLSLPSNRKNIETENKQIAVLLA